MKMSLFSVDIVRLGSGAEPLLVVFVFSPIVTEAIFGCNLASTAHFDDRQPPPQVFVDSGAKSAEKGACTMANQHLSPSVTHGNTALHLCSYVLNELSINSTKRVEEDDVGRKIVFWSVTQIREVGEAVICILRP